MVVLVCFFFNDTATTEIYTLSLHDALPICWRRSSTRPARATPSRAGSSATWPPPASVPRAGSGAPSKADRKSTRLNSSHGYISYAVFCLKKKKYTTISQHHTHSTDEGHQHH